MQNLIYNCFRVDNIIDLILCNCAGGFKSSICFKVDLVEARDTMSV